MRGGGHNIAGLAVCEGGLMIDMSLMRGVWVDPARHVAQAQAGCTLGDVDRETQLHGLAAVLGLRIRHRDRRAHGRRRLRLPDATATAGPATTVVSMEVVTAAGAGACAPPRDENADLFWALRGGGGNFGIVTSFEYRLVPVGPEILGGAIAWRGEDAGRCSTPSANSAPRRRAS